MISKYEIREIGNEEILVLYLNFNYEFAADNKSKNTGMVKKINNFLKAKKINFNGNKVVLVVGGLILGSLVLGSVPNKAKINDQKFDYVGQIILNHYDQDNEIKSYDKITINEDKIETIVNDNQNTYTPPTNDVINNNSVEEIIQDQQEQETMVTVYRSNGTIDLVELEDYVVGVVASEMPALFNIEALKAQAVAARTYALRAISKDQVLTDTVSTQVYKDNGQLKIMWGSSYNSYFNKVKDAALATRGMYITYDSEYIEVLYHSTSNGMTENSYDVYGREIPYLSSVTSSADLSATSYLRNTTISFQEITNALGFNFNETTDIEISSRTASGRVASVRINGEEYTGIEFRNLFGLRSTDFSFQIVGGSLVVTTRGYGHGVGMSQYGANGMANQGKTFIEILKHYYQGVTVKK